MMPQFRLSARLGAATSEEAAESAEAMDESAVAFFDALDDMTERLRRAALRLESEPWDLFVAVFMATDRVQHVLWDEVVGSDPDSPLGRRLGEVYRNVDRAVGELVDAAGPDAVTIVMSDHGFGRCAGNFSMSRWLVDEGFATYQPRRAYGTARRLAGAAGLRRLARRAMGRSSLGKTVRRSSLPLRWSETRAYLQPGTYGGIRVNLKGRESEGMVEPGREYDELRAELRERLLAIRDPETGGSVVSAVRFAEEVHEGPEVRWAPDVLVEPNPELGYHIAPGDLAKSELVWRDPKTRGGHRPEGIFLLSGRGVRPRNEFPPIEITDIAPTALWLLGLPVPDDMDGGELVELFDGAPVMREVVRGRDGEGSREGASGTGSEGQSESDREEILSRLKDLGYVD
jgi:predicted AlkP superfamily phosphohydrolase/phosphomutase